LAEVLFLVLLCSFEGCVVAMKPEDKARQNIDKLLEAEEAIKEGNQK